MPQKRLAQTFVMIWMSDDVSDWVRWFKSQNDLTTKQRGPTRELTSNVWTRCPALISAVTRTAPHNTSRTTRHKKCLRSRTRTRYIRDWLHENRWFFAPSVRPSVPLGHYCLVVSLMVAARVCGQFEGFLDKEGVTSTYLMPWKLATLTWHNALRQHWGPIEVISSHDAEENLWESHPDRAATVMLWSARPWEPCVSYHESGNTEKVVSWRLETDKKYISPRSIASMLLSRSA